MIRNVSAQVIDSLDGLSHASKTDKRQDVKDSLAKLLHSAPMLCLNYVSDFLDKLDSLRQHQAYEAILYSYNELTHSNQPLSDDTFLSAHVYKNDFKVTCSVSLTVFIIQNITEDPKGHNDGCHFEDAIFVFLSPSTEKLDAVGVASCETSNYNLNIPSDMRDDGDRTNYPPCIDYREMAVFAAAFGIDVSDIAMLPRRRLTETDNVVIYNPIDFCELDSNVLSTVASFTPKPPKAEKFLHDATITIGMKPCWSQSAQDLLSTSIMYSCVTAGRDNKFDLVTHRIAQFANTAGAINPITRLFKDLGTQSDDYSFGWCIVRSDFYGERHVEGVRINLEPQLHSHKADNKLHLEEGRLRCALFTVAKTSEISRICEL